MKHLGRRGQLPSVAGAVVLFLILLAVLTYGIVQRTTKESNTLTNIVSEALRNAFKSKETCTTGTHATKSDFAQAFTTLDPQKPSDADAIIDLYADLLKCFGVQPELWTPGFLGGKKVEPTKIVLASAETTFKPPVTLDTAATLKRLGEKFKMVLTEKQFEPYAPILPKADIYVRCAETLKIIDSLLTTAPLDLASAATLLNANDLICWSYTANELGALDQKRETLVNKLSPQERIVYSDNIDNRLRLDTLLNRYPVLRTLGTAKSPKI